jgi:copper(I)-binding protein/cytochrome oxidase Cu insertion factor (SCO1/SenC/PrrC family)
MRAAVRHFWRALVVTTFLLGIAPSTSVASVWGANYFPNVPLITHDGETVRFFDDLIEDKVVLINFIYTSCVDTCPMETAQLTQVQKILGDRLGKDVFFYSISIDPEHDTPEVLKDYRDRFRAKWTFLTGHNDDIIELRKKLGLYIEEIQDGSNNHNVNMIIGNQATGRWMKRSPFENPYVLADQLGNWLTDWKAPPRGDSYANAPKLRTIPRGEQLFRTRCSICHTITGSETDGVLGPDLLGVTDQRDMNWLINWLRAPDQMLAANDPIATALLAEYNDLPMPNVRLNQKEAMDLLDYIATETQRLGTSMEYAATTSVAPAEYPVRILNAWVREADPKAKANAGYMTLINVGAEEVTLVEIRSDAFDKVEMHEMAVVDGAMKMRELDDLIVPANGQVKFSPGGQHLMMKGPRDYLSTGKTVDLTLVFRSGIEQLVSVRVAAR